MRAEPGESLPFKQQAEKEAATEAGGEAGTAGGEADQWAPPPRGTGYIGTLRLAHSQIPDSWNESSGNRIVCSNRFGAGSHSCWERWERS